MNTNELKPGDRVRLTGLNSPDLAFFKQYSMGQTFPYIANVYSNGINLTVDFPHSENWKWSIDWFTYEKIETDGNG